MQQLWETILKSAGLEETQFIESLFLVKLFDVYEGINFLKFCDENNSQKLFVLFHLNFKFSDNGRIFILRR